MAAQIDKIVSITTALITDSKGRVLLLKRSNHSSYPDTWQFVEGKIEEGENAEEGLQREIHEEIGVSASKIQIYTVFPNLLEANGQNYLAFRLVFYVDIESDNIKLSNEHMDFGWFTKAEALELPLLPGVSAVIQKIL